MAVGKIEYPKMSGHKRPISNFIIMFRSLTKKPRHHVIYECENGKKSFDWFLIWYQKRAR